MRIGDHKPFLFLFLFSSLSLLSLSSPISILTVGDDSAQCVYTVYVRTGSVWKGGTDSVISVDFAGSDGYGVRITDLAAWGGLMGPDYNYYERGNLDIFSGRGPCLSSPPCWMNLTSDGGGPHHGWYCNYVEVTATGPHVPCAQKLFDVEQWLATDTKPHQLFAVRDLCTDRQAGSSGIVRAEDRAEARGARALRAGVN